jgi:hypothetical protein
MVARRSVSLAVLALAVAALAGCATDNPLTPNGGIDATAPSAPTHLVAEDRAGSLVISWDASADADVVGYDVFRYSPDPARENSYVKINSGLVVGTEYVVADAPALASWYRVKAVDAGANASSASGALAAAKPSYGSVDDGGVHEPAIDRSARP